MFKTPLKLESRSALTRKEQKKFSHDISKFFNTESFEAFIDQNNLTISRNNYIGEAIKIYSSGSIALFIDSSGKGDWFPSIDAVKKCPDLTQSVQVKEGVETFLKEGASLRCEDVKDFKALGSFKQDDIRYVKSSDNQVIAIGAMACDSSEVDGGFIMDILHVVGDSLWNFVPQCREGTVFAEDYVDDGEKVKKTKEVKKQGEEEEKKEPETDDCAENVVEKVEKKEPGVVLKDDSGVKEDEDQGKKKGEEDGEKIQVN